MASGETPRTKVLLDASNIMFQGSATDEEGKAIPDANVLQSAFELYEKLDYDVEAVMTEYSYKRHRRSKNPGASILSKLVKSGKLDTITGDDDDIILLLRSVEEEAYTVTYDKFDDKVRDGKTTERQRSLYPDLPWDEIDKYTRGTEKQKDGTIKSGKHWHVSGTAFYDPGMPRAPKRIFENKFNELFKATEDLESVLTKLGSLLEGHSEDDLPKKASLGKRLAHMHDQALRMKADIPEDKLDEESLDGHTVVELKSIARDLEISGRSNKKKEQLIQMIKDHITPSPEKIKEDAKKVVADLVQQAGIQATKRREESRPKSKDKYPKTSRKSKGEMKTAQCGEVVVNNLRKTAPQARPRKKSTLIGHIKSLRSRSWSENVYDEHILNWLKQKGLILISDNDTKSVKYNL